MMHFVGGSNTR